MDNILLFLAKNPCDDINVLRLVVLFKQILNIVFIVVPIILIVLVMIDITKNVIAKSQDEIGKNNKLIIKRFIYAVAVFFVPVIVRVFMSSLGDLSVDYGRCLNITKESLAIRTQSEMSKCNAIGMEWNEGSSECVEKKEYKKIDPNDVKVVGHGGLTAKRDVSNSNDNYEPDDNTGKGDFNGKFRLPLAGDSIYITSGYGPRSCKNCSSFHRGLDLRAGEKTTVYAVEGGIVVNAAYMGARGNCIIIKHKDGLYTFYQHLNQMLLKAGDKVDKGMIVGLSGHTGGDYAPHLHFEVTSSPVGGITAYDPCTYTDYKCSNNGKTGGHLSLK